MTFRVNYCCRALRERKRDGDNTDLECGHDSVVPASGALGRALVPLGRALQEERGRQASEHGGMLRHERRGHVHAAGQTHRYCGGGRVASVRRATGDGRRTSVAGEYRGNNNRAQSVRRRAAVFSAEPGTRRPRRHARARRPTPELRPRRAAESRPSSSAPTRVGWTAPALAARVYRVPHINRVAVVDRGQDDRSGMTGARAGVGRLGRSPGAAPRPRAETVNYNFTASCK